jgi:hypothetical protein
MMEAPFTGPKPNPGPGSPDKEVAAACPQTGLRALVAIARHLGLDWSLQRMLHNHGAAHEPDPTQLARIARVEGLNAANHKLNWDRLQNFAKLIPFLARIDKDC